MNRPADNVWLHRFALLTALATFGLIGMGGLVTSKGAGMTVPDWPTSYGYNMFLFPIRFWQGGIFYEHAHRLWASVVGLLTAILAGWIWARENSGKAKWGGLAAIFFTLGLMGVRTQGMFVALASLAVGVIIFSLKRAATEERPLRWWAAIAFAAVLIQGVLGGLRVTMFKDQIGIFHGTLAQMFLVLLCLLAMVTGQRWQTLRTQSISLTPGLRKMLWVTTGLILFQLMLGATMRHQHAGLAVPDFPLAYGKIWPPTDAAALELINLHRTDVREFNAITPAQIYLHMLHRLTAFTIVLAVGANAWQIRRQLGARAPLARLSLLWVGLIITQATLGAWTVWSNKAADIATLHVVTGAANLVVGAVLTLAAIRCATSVAQSKNNLNNDSVCGVSAAVAVGQAG